MKGSEHCGSNSNLTVAWEVDDSARGYGSPHGRPAGAGVLYKSCLCRGRASRYCAHGVLLRDRLLLLHPSWPFQWPGELTSNCPTGVVAHC